MSGPLPVKLVRLTDEAMSVRGAGRRNQRGERRIIPWQLQWADGTPLNVGLFEDEEAYQAWKTSGRNRP